MTGGDEPNVLNAEQVEEIRRWLDSTSWYLAPNRGKALCASHEVLRRRHDKTRAALQRIEHWPVDVNVKPESDLLAIKEEARRVLAAVSVEQSE